MRSPAKSAKVLLIADRRPARAQTSGVPVRRYRLARLRPASGQPGASSFEYLKRVYD